MSDVVEFPSPPEPPALLVGPFQSYKVVVEGRVIPKLTGHPHEDGTVSLVLDGRFAGQFSEDDARSVAWLIANALAIGEGYPSMNAESKDHPFAPRCIQVGEPQ